MASKARTGKTRRQTTGATGGSAEDRAIDAAFTLIVEKGWRTVTNADIAAAAKLELPEYHALFPTKNAVLDAFVRRIDRAALAGPEIDAEASVRDRLFDLLMRRFDALRPHRAAVAALARQAPLNPLTSLGLGFGLCRSLAGVAALAGVETTGLFGVLRIKALVAIYLSVLRTWLSDEGADDSKTMAALDAALRRAETLARSLPSRRPAAPPV
jgi:AcrR family transcriptional regulator